MFFTTKRATMFIVSIALFMDVLDSNVINTAVPAMARTFLVNPIDIKIALISYLLSLAIFIPMSGWVADKYGVKNIFIAAMGLFTVSSFFCGNAHTLPLLVFARFIQGIGGAFMISLGRLILARTFKQYELVEAMNVVIIVVAFAVMIGPWVGGVIVDHFSWPWIFWVNIPIGIGMMLFAQSHLKEISVRNPRPFDFLGFALFGGGLAMLALSLSEMSQTQDSFDHAFLRLIIALLMLGIFILHARRKKHPAINIQLFRLRTFSISVFGNLAARLGFGGLPFLLPLMQQVGLGFSAQLSGLLLVPSAFGIIFSKIFAAKVLRKMGYRRYLMFNTCLVGVGLWMFLFVNHTTPIYLIGIFTFIYGVITAAQYTGMNSLALADIQDEQLSYSTSITSTTQILAQSLGVAVSAILLRLFSMQLEKTTMLTMSVFHDTFFTLGILTLFSLMIFLRLKPTDGQQMLERKQ